MDLYMDDFYMPRRNSLLLNMCCYSYLTNRYVCIPRKGGLAKDESQTSAGIMWAFAFEYKVLTNLIQVCRLTWYNWFTERCASAITHQLCRGCLDDHLGPHHSALSCWLTAL
jgi:hypothetical protein